MTCELVVDERVVLVVWGTPELDDLVQLEQTICAVYEERGPVVFIARVPPSAPPPDELFRAELTKVLGRFMSRLVSYHAVVEGRGFFAAAKRTVLATIFLMSGQSRAFNVHATVEEVLPAVPPGYREEVRSALSYFRLRGHFAHSLRPQAKARAS